MRRFYSRTRWAGKQLQTDDTAVTWRPRALRARNVDDAITTPQCTLFYAVYDADTADVSSR